MKDPEGTTWTPVDRILDKTKELTPDRGWMNPLNKLKWREAIKAQKPTVTIDDGRVFCLDYNRRPGKVHYYPKKNPDLGVPRGWLDYERVVGKEGEWVVQ